MCGIVGVVKQSQQAIATREEVALMLRTVAPRGPDHQAVSVCGHLGFGHSRLSILDVSERGNQPFCTPDARGMLVYNGEIYNFRELRAELEAEGVHFVSGTDTEVVLHALHTWGAPRAVPRFNGMFALAYADLRCNTT